MSSTTEPPPPHAVPAQLADQGAGSLSLHISDEDGDRVGVFSSSQPASTVPLSPSNPAHPRHRTNSRTATMTRPLSPSSMARARDHTLSTLHSVLARVGILPDVQAGTVVEDVDVDHHQQQRQPSLDDLLTLAQLGYELLQEKEIVEYKLAATVDREMMLAQRLADADSARTFLERQLHLTTTTATSAAGANDALLNDLRTEVRRLTDLLTQSHVSIESLQSQLTRAYAHVGDLEADVLRRKQASRDAAAALARASRAEAELQVIGDENAALKMELARVRLGHGQERKAMEDAVRREVAMEQQLALENELLRASVREVEAREFESQRRIAELARDMEEYARLLAEAREELAYLEEEKSSTAGTRSEYGGIAGEDLSFVSGDFSFGMSGNLLGGLEMEMGGGGVGGGLPLPTTKEVEVQVGAPALGIMRVDRGHEADRSAMESSDEDVDEDEASSSDEEAEQEGGDGSFSSSWFPATKVAAAAARRRMRDRTASANATLTKTSHAISVIARLKSRVRAGTEPPPAPSRNNSVGSMSTSSSVQQHHQQWLLDRDGVGDDNGLSLSFLSALSAKAMPVAPSSVGSSAASAASADSQERVVNMITALTEGASDTGSPARSRAHSPSRSAASSSASAAGRRISVVTSVLHAVESLKAATASTDPHSPSSASQPAHPATLSLSTVSRAARAAAAAATSTKSPLHPTRRPSASGSMLGIGSIKQDLGGPYPEHALPANMSLLHWRLMASPHLAGARGFMGDILTQRKPASSRRPPSPSDGTNTRSKSKRDPEADRAHRAARRSLSRSIDAAMGVRTRKMVWDAQISSMESLGIPVDNMAGDEDDEHGDGERIAESEPPSAAGLAGAFSGGGGVVMRTSLLAREQQQMARGRSGFAGVPVRSSPLAGGANGDAVDGRPRLSKSSPVRRDSASEVAMAPGCEYLDEQD